jgi:Cu+-exporting ATPase
MAICPACGMEIDEKRARGTSTVEGKTYHFCSKACKKKFDASPEKYTRK